MGGLDREMAARLALLLLICSTALVLTEAENGLPGGLDKADTADPGQAQEPLAAEVPAMSAPVNKNDENAAEMAIELSKQETEAEEADEVAQNLKLRNAAAESMMGPMRASEDGDERDMTSIIKAAHEKQKVARENVDKKADAEAANKQTHEMNMQLANAGVVPPVAPPVVAAVVAAVVPPVQQLPNATVVPPAQAPPNTTEAAEAEIASTPGADELSQSIEAEAAEAEIASTLAVDAVDAAPKVEETAPEVEETAPEVEQEAAAAETQAAAPAMTEEQEQLVQSIVTPPELPPSATASEKKAAALTTVMPQQIERQQQASAMAKAARQLKELRKDHAQKLAQDNSVLKYQKTQASHTVQVAGVLAQASKMLDDSQQHLADVRAAIPDAEMAVHKARHAASQEAAELESDLSKHSLTPGALATERDEEDQQGQVLMDHKILEKQEHAQQGLEEVARQREQLSKDMRDAMNLVEKAATTVPGEAPRLGHLRTQLAKDHLETMHRLHREQQKALDEIQAKYQKAEDQLRSTQIQNLLYDAHLAGTVTSAEMEELKHKMQLSAAADRAFEKAVAMVHALKAEERDSEVAIEAGFPVLEQVITSLKQIPK